MKFYVEPATTATRRSANVDRRSETYVRAQLDRLHGIEQMLSPCVVFDIGVGE
jgi:hypothetical protein